MGILDSYMFICRGSAGWSIRSVTSYNLRFPTFPCSGVWLFCNLFGYCSCHTCHMLIRVQAEYEKRNIFIWKLEQPQSYQPSQKGSGFTQSSWGSSWFRSLMVSYLFGWMVFHLLLCIAFTKEMFLSQSFKLSGLVILVPRYDDPGEVWRKKSLGVEYCIAKTHHLVVFCMDISSWALKAIPASQACHGITLKILFRLVLGSPFWRWSSFARYTSVALALWSNERKFCETGKNLRRSKSHLHISYIFSNVAFGGTKKCKKQTAHHQMVPTVVFSSIITT